MTDENTQSPEAPEQPAKKKKKAKPKAYTVPRQPMPAQSAEERIHNFKEVALGYTEEQALTEAERCLHCKKPKCNDGCPVFIDIPGFIKAINARDYLHAAEIIKKDNFMPAICGRVCQQENQCELTCVIRKKVEPVAIGRLERFVADYEAEHRGGEIKLPELPPPSGFKVGIIGSGPAGLTAAFDMRMLGHEVTIFEALHKPGGVLTYGIPEFRMPNYIIEENVRYLEALGVELKTNFVIGLIASLEELMSPEWGYDALFIGTGAGLPRFLNIPGENLCGVFSANEFLTRVNLMSGYKFPEYDTPLKLGENVVVLGAGNTAMDASRTSIRLKQPKRVMVVYRRSDKEVPARAEEFEHAKEEGVEFHFYTAPVRILGDENGWVRAMECVKMELGEPDDSGRRRPLEIPGSNFEFPCQTVINAIGSASNKTLFQGAPDLQLNRWGYIEANQETGQTNLPGVFAGGDIIGGGATVIKAMGDGRNSAKAMHEYLQTLDKPVASSKA
jgi:glutamate synthase (NADPH/NADH) small chain